MDEPFSEHREVSMTEPLSQGDVLEAVNTKTSIWQRHLLIITADCDLAFAKHQGRVTCVPLLPAGDYLSEMQVPRIREQLANKQVDYIKKTISKHRSNKISDQRLREWATEEEPENIAKQLGLPREESKKIEASLKSIRLIDQKTSELKESVRNLIDSQMTGNGTKKRESVKKEITGRLRGVYTQPPGDAFFLSSIASGQSQGYFAYLRQIEQVWEPQISLGPTRKKTGYRRISHIEDRFTHALIQRFAMVFMSIGLPTEYEQIRDLHADVLGDDLA
ncbi:hypothetical protein [Nocardiopsis tropica]|uniref:PIN like domain-containing protein n=1 Tax=Nocardiopsis tropica TaxID=109330 RepID=A0ABV1ZZY7_9ACTN